MLTKSIFEPMFEAGEEYATAIGSLTVPSGLGCERQNPCPMGMICSYHEYSRWCTPCPEREAGLDGLVCEMCPSGQGPSDGRFDFPVAPSTTASTRCGDGRCGGCVKCAGSVETCVGDADGEGRVCKLKVRKDAKLAQKLGQLQPFIAAFPQECMGQLAYYTFLFGPTLHLYRCSAPSTTPTTTR